LGVDPTYPSQELKMNITFKNTLCHFLAIALIIVPFQTSQASMISTEQVSSAASVQLDRTTVLNFLSRSQTANQLQAHGLDTQAAMERVALMTDDEVTSLAGRVNAAPVGADGAVALVLVVFFIWYFAFRR
jgi:hypothetical protein